MSNNNLLAEVIQQAADLENVVPTRPDADVTAAVKDLTAELTALREEIQRNEERASERHKEALRASKLDWLNFVCAAVAALGVLVPACVWLISHLCNNV